MANKYEEGMFADAVVPFDFKPSNSSTRLIEPVEGGLRFDKDAPCYDMSGKKYLIILNQHTFEKTEHFNTRPIEPVEGGLRFDKDAPCYDMSGKKFLIILNQHTFEKTKHFKETPSKRNGTENDVRRLKEVFYKLGFLIFVFKDFKYQNIIDFLTGIVNLGHTRTSCVCVTILTHGDKLGELYAADRPYLLSEVMAIFGKEPSLINKPKLFFVQACRGENMDAGHRVPLGSPSNSVPTASPKRSNRATSSEEMPMLQTGHTDDAQYLGFCCYLSEARARFWMNAGNTDLVNSQSDNFLTVPTHADILVLRSTVEDHLSFRDNDGSWMIQALCDTIQDYHMDHNLLDMIVLMNRTVAYDKITRKCRWKPMENKKQMPETNFTITKQVKFETGPVVP